MVDAVTASAASAAASTSRTSLADNFQMFLTLLTEQMKNQDPLNPLDSTEFVNQLVQFSSVEQQITQNDKLSTLIDLQTASVGSTMAGYLGQDVIAEGATAPLQDGNAGWTFVVDETPKSVSVVITNAAGKVVFETEAETASGVQNYVWDGKDAAGEDLPPGAYTLQVTARNDADELIKVDIAAKGRVTGVDLSTPVPALLMGDIRVPFAAVISVREHVDA